MWSVLNRFIIQNRSKFSYICFSFQMILMTIYSWHQVESLPLLLIVALLLMSCWPVVCLNFLSVARHSQSPCDLIAGVICVFAQYLLSLLLNVLCAVTKDSLQFQNTWSLQYKTVFIGIKKSSFLLHYLLIRCSCNVI